MKSKGQLKRERVAEWNRKTKEAKSERRANGGLTRKQVMSRKGGKKAPSLTPGQKKHRTYIASAAWKDRKREYFSSHPKVCVACGSGRNVHLHHKTYVRLGRELDSDLVPLCAGCHSKVHALHQASQDPLELVTNRFINPSLWR